MSSGSYMQAYVRCPFYEWDDGKRRITCEGIIDNSSITLSFQNREDFDIHIKAFCCHHYDKCEVNAMLLAKYEDEPLLLKKAVPRKPPVKTQQISLFDQ